MVLPAWTTTLTRVSKVDEDLEEITNSSGIDFSEFPVGDPLNKKYVFLNKEDSYAIIVSKNLEGVHPKYGYNLILTITSYSSEQNEKVARKFGKKTGVKLREAPKILEGLMNATVNRMLDMII